MEYQSKKRKSRRCLIVLAVVFIIVVVIVGVVTWKVTKDAYEGSGSPTKVNPDAVSGDDGTTTMAPEVTTKRTYSEEELRTQPWLSLRLRRDVLPVHYDITMFPDFYDGAGEFYGNETIELEVAKSTNHILIHIHPDYINVTGVSVHDESTDTDLNIKRTFVYRKNEFFVTELTETLTAGTRVSITLQFQGSLTKGIVGIYKSSYLDTVTKETRYLASSKFEPTYARRAFPCFDEPNVKANYTITLIHRPEYKALSNMPEDPEQPEPVEWDSNLVSTRFQRSVKMSTYLVIFTVCEFTSLNTTSSRGIPIRAFATPDKVSQAQYAMEVAKTAMDLYEKLFEEDYPLPKQDLIGVPDFVSGAMEHWGLISFREVRMLVQDNKTSLAAQEGVAHTVAHEVAHMWFGNLVTMDWWNDLWLNEGFASFMEYLGADKHNPGWDIMSKFLIEDMYRVMDQDSALSSHPIIVDVQHPRQITSVFDAISYSKGASVIRMLETIMGRDKFFSGVARYLKQHKWGNAKTDDLWNALSEVDPNHNVKHIMDTWTLQDGFPYISISLDTASDGLTTVSATQTRFLLNKDTVLDTSSSPLGYKWYVQLDYKTSNGLNGSVVMDMNDTTFSDRLGLEVSGSWIKFNLDQNHFYRVLYPDSMWTALSTYLKQTPYENWELSGADRAGLLADAFKLASAGLINYSIPLDLMAYLRKEKDFVPWRVALSQGISYIYTMLQNDPDFGLWKNFLSKQIAPVANVLGFSDDGDHLKKQLRPSIQSMACSLGIGQTLHSVNEEFRSWQDHNVLPSVNMREVVYECGMAENGTDEVWERVWNQYLVEPSPTEKRTLTGSLISTRKPHLIARLLDRAKRAEGIKRQDFFNVISGMAANPAANAQVWDWARENYQSFIDRFTLNDRYFGRMVYYIVRNYNTEFKLKEVKDFFAAYPEAGTGERYRRMALEGIQTNIDWMKNYKPQIMDWLKSRPNS